MKILFQPDHSYYSVEEVLTDIEEDPDLLTVNSPLQVTGSLRREEDRLSVSLSITGEVAYPCSRCLEPVNQSVDLSVEESFENKGDYFDLSNFVKDILIAYQPTKVLCDENCKGLCPNCGVNLNKETCTCFDQEQIDPRFEILKQIQFDS